MRFACISKKFSRTQPCGLSDIDPTGDGRTAVVVLGFSCDHRAGKVSLPLTHRLAHAARVSAALPASHILCTGGLDPAHGEVRIFLFCSTFIYLPAYMIFERKDLCQD